MSGDRNPDLSLTLCALARCSEVSIARGPRQTRSRAQPHMQLLPGHGGGRLSGCLVGRWRPPALSSEVHRYLKIPPACAYSVQVAPEENDNEATRQQQNTQMFEASFFCLSSLRSLSLCLLGTHSLPANGTRPRGEALSGTGKLWETAALLLSISMATWDPGGMRAAG